LQQQWFSNAIRKGTEDGSDNACTVTGIVAWRTRSLKRKAIAAGTARYQLTFSAGGQLLSEWSEVLSRVGQMKD
jgi:hypothetical protein